MDVSEGGASLNRQEEFDTYLLAQLVHKSHSSTYYNIVVLIL